MGTFNHLLSYQKWTVIQLNVWLGMQQWQLYAYSERKHQNENCKQSMLCSWVSEASSLSLQSSCQGWTDEKWNSSQMKLPIESMSVLSLPLKPIRSHSEGETFCCPITPDTHLHLLIWPTSTHPKIHFFNASLSEDLDHTLLVLEGLQQYSAHRQNCR